MTHTRYSPEPLESYRFAPMFKFLREDAAAWDLAYLSWNFEERLKPPDANLSTAVRRTLQFVVATGKIDLANEFPNNVKVRDFLRHPAPKAVKLISEMPNLYDVPLYRAYGVQWLTTLKSRSHLYREPPDKDYDFDVQVLTQAAEVIAKIR